MKALTHKAPLATLFFTVLLDMIGVGVLIPVLPLLFTNVISSEYLLPAGASLQEGYFLLGALLGIFSLGQFFAAPIIGELSDIYGRKRMLAFSIFGSAAGYFLFSGGIATKSLALVFASRLLNGITGGNIVVAQAAIADLSKPEQRAKNFGMIGAAFGLGFIIGPFIGGKLADSSLVPWFSSMTPFLFSGTLSCINGLLILWLLPETNKHRNEMKKLTWLRSVRNIKWALSLTSLRSLFVTNFLFQFGFSFYMTFASVFFFTRFGFNESALGNYFAYIGLWIVITQGFITGFIAKRFSESAVIRNTLFLASIAIVAILTIPNAFWLFFVAPFFSMSIGLTQANMTALLSRSADTTSQGEILGLNGSLQALAMALPPFLSGFVAAITSPEAPLAIAAVTIAFAGLYFANRFQRTLKAR